MRSIPLFRKERGIALLAMMVLLMVVTAVVMVNQAVRISSSGATDTAALQRLNAWMTELKYASVMHAITEDNTPGAFPCPEEKPSCAASAAALAGKPPSLNNLDLPDSSPRSSCIQYSLAPSLRNFLTNDIRGIKAQKRINPGFVPDLLFTDSDGKSTPVWAVLIADTSSSAGCSLASLGYALSYDSASGTASVVPAAGAARSLTMLIEKRDVIRGLLINALQSVDISTFKAYLNSYFLTHPAGKIPLSNIRSDNPVAFDAALLPAGTTLALGSDCSGTISTSSSASSSASPSVTYKNAVSWLCFNAWHDFITFDSTVTSFSVSDPETGMGCTRKDGVTTCAN